MIRWDSLARRPFPMKRSRKAYTLRELVVILAINALLLCLLVPTIIRVRHAAAEAPDARAAAAKARPDWSAARTSRFARPAPRQPRLPGEPRKVNASNRGVSAQSVSYNFPQEF